ncbi:MAG: hypothetical protein AAF940_07460 [Pseudomonadota bacterium]
MKRLSSFGVAALLWLCAPVIVFSASVTNGDADPLTLVITENGERSEVVLAGNQTQSLCATGCFLTLPNGDRVVLSGGETVSISGGRAIID